MRLARFLPPFALAAALLVAAAPAKAADPDKVFRYAFAVAETTLDPQKISDLYSNILNSSMFEPPLKYDYLARPLKLKPNTLVAMPEISADGLTYTLRVKPGIFFADDPGVQGEEARAGGRGLRLLDQAADGPEARRAAARRDRGHHPRQRRGAREARARPTGSTTTRPSRA